MARYVALLRAVNVGGTGKLSMADLRAVCSEAGLTSITTYIASGNVIFDSPADASAIKAELERRLADLTGKPVGVLLRTSTELAQVLADNPFPAEEARHTYVLFLTDPPSRAVPETAVGKTDERISLGRREIYVTYPTGMGRSKLKLPDAKTGTARNMNTVAKLVELSTSK